MCLVKIMDELTKEQKIDKEEKKLLKLYKNLPKTKQTLVKPLIQNAAFMAVTLRELQEAINENGCVEEYQHGKNQSGKKATTEAQTYNSMIKNYTAIIDKLDKLLPPEKAKSRLQALIDE